MLIKKLRCDAAVLKHGCRTIYSVVQYHFKSRFLKNSISSGSEKPNKLFGLHDLKKRWKLRFPLMRLSVVFSKKNFCGLRCWHSFQDNRSTLQKCEYNGKSFTDKTYIFFCAQLANYDTGIFLISCLVRFTFEYFSCHHHEHTDERDVSSFCHCIKREINNKIIFFTEQQLWNSFAYSWEIVAIIFLSNI